MKKIFFWLLFLIAAHNATGQVNWKDTTLSFSKISWDNYSTSYLGEGSDSVPIIATAIPYNGVYSFGEADRTPMDMSFTGSAFHFRSNLKTNQVLYTYDSAAVYFLAPGLFQSNANAFEYRVLQDDSLIIKPWSNITSFADTSFQLNEFRAGFAFLGGYASTWGHYVTIELRRKKQQSLLAGTTVYWQQVKPAIQFMLTAQQLNQWLLHLKRPLDNFSGANDLPGWKDQYSSQDIDSATGLPKRMILSAGEKELYVFVGGNIYSKTALEYRVKKNGREITGWKPNNTDNNYIWLHDMAPGEYELGIRYRKQRHNITTYSFAIKPAWFQSWYFKLGIGILVLTFLAFLIVAFKLKKQRKKMVAEQLKQEKLKLGLQSVAAQLNPHFIFNALASIQGLINKNDIAGANHYLSVFGSLLRSSLSNNEKTLIPLEQEIRTLEIYLALEKLRFNFTYTIYADKQVQVAEMEIPPLLLQPLVENAVKHGVAMLQEKGEIRIVFERQANDLLIRISDNGHGFTPGQQQEGYGLKLTRQRIQLLNELAAEKRIQMNISSGQVGTAIELLFNNWL